MIRSSDPKQVFSASLLELLLDKPLAKISVKEVIDNCDLSKQTFYRHFKDKYDLINWTMKTMWDQLNKEFEADFSSYYETTVRLLTVIKDHKDFYIGAFKMDVQNSLMEFFYQYCVEFSMKHSSDKTRDPVLQENLNFAIRFASYGTVNCIVDWALAGMKESPQQMAEMLIDAYPKAVLYLYQQHGDAPIA